MKLTTSVYKYKRAAIWMLVLMILVTIAVFFYSNVIGIVLLVACAIYAAIRPNSIFSVRSVDERQLVLNPEELLWGTLRMPIQEVEKLEIYIHAFDSFRHAAPGLIGKKMPTSEYGDKNTISFTYRGVSYDLTFYLGTFSHYDTLFRIIQSWREKGIELSARSFFQDSFIREQTKQLG